MNELRVLLFGSDSAIGRALCALPLPPEWKFNALTFAACDFKRPSEIGKTIQDFVPDLVINTAVFADIDTCEKNLSEATEINFHAVANMAAQCSTLNALLIHLSSDQVFDGHDVGAPYEPDAAMNPLNIFGQTMMMGEEAVRHSLDWHVILRTSMVFSHTPSYLTEILHFLDQGEAFEAATDRIRSPTSASSVARAMIHIAQAILHGKADGFGTFHVSDLEPSSDYVFAQEILKIEGTSRKSGLLRGFKISERPDAVPLPLYSALSGKKLETMYQIKQHLWRDGLAAALAQYRH